MRQPPANVGNVRKITDFSEIPKRSEGALSLDIVVRDRLVIGFHKGRTKRIPVSILVAIGIPRSLRSGLRKRVIK
jgi:hypothetical protein